MYSDEKSHLDLSGVAFLDLSSGVCPDPVVECVSNIDWVDSYGDDCEVYAENLWYCGYEESGEKCCACGGGEVPCVSNDWVDSYGDGCEFYAENLDYCGDQESGENCCACGGGQSSQSCEPAGTGGGYYAAIQVTVSMKAVQFQP